MTRFLLRQGAQVTVTDLRSAEELAPSLEALRGEAVRFVLGRHRLEDFRQADLIVRNPAVPRDSPFLEEARRHGVPIEMEMTLFFERCPGTILGVTGTKGKSTTTALLGEMLRQRFPDTVVAGNIRVSALDALPRIGVHTPVVLELSSWQLEGLGERRMSPPLAVVTNLHPDHLNRYRCWSDYVEAKRQVFRFQGPQDLLVLNGDDAEVRAFALEAPGEVAWFGVGLTWAQGALRAGDGWDLPLRAGAALLQQRWIVWVDQEGAIERICPQEEIALAGRHNLENVVAATAVARLFGLSPDEIAPVLRRFRGLADRLEVVAAIGGVTFINDTTSTAPVSTIAALETLSGPIVLIAGGADKDLPFEELGGAIAGRVRAVVLLEGTATDRLQRILLHYGVPIAGRFTEMAAAVSAAYAVARPGDTVLLSPACASFGLFRHEFERGERFREAVAALAACREDGPALRRSSVERDSVV